MRAAVELNTLLPSPVNDAGPSARHRSALRWWMVLATILLGCSKTNEVDVDNTPVPADGGCFTASDCSGHDTDCRRRACEQGACVFVSESQGKDVSSQIPGDCRKAVCDGDGGIAQQTDDGDSPQPANPCEEGACTATGPKVVPRPQGAACGQGGACDGNGACSQCKAGDRRNDCVDAASMWACDGGSWKPQPCAPPKSICDHGICVGGTALVWITHPSGWTYGIEATEVTRAQYGDWLASAPSTAIQPAECTGNVFEPSCPPMSCTEPGSTAHPQTCVDWCDALAYCRAMGKRLCGRIGDGGEVPVAQRNDPSASEWVHACTAGGKHAWPYGSAGDAQACAGEVWFSSKGGCAGADALGSAPVQSAVNCHAAEPPFSQVYDLSGNVSEWENSCDADGCWTRGGSFENTEFDLKCETSSALQQLTRKDGTQSVGFRCCAH
jgi:hypothetical protein